MRLPLTAKGAALVVAFFPLITIAGEWEAYLELKAAMVRSTAKATRPLPKWLEALDFEPRPHYWLDRGKPPPPVVILGSESPNVSPTSSAPVAAASTTGGR